VTINYVDKEVFNLKPDDEAHKLNESKILETELREKIDFLETKLEQHKEVIDNLEQNIFKLKAYTNNIARYLKILLWLIVGLFGCGIAILTLTPPVVIGLWIIFATIIIVIAIFYFLIKLTFKNLE
jgi:hypothetical protein